jgi:hypothetical protein
MTNDINTQTADLARGRTRQHRQETQYQACQAFARREDTWSATSIVYRYYHQFNTTDLARKQCFGMSRMSIYHKIVVRVNQPIDIDAYFDKTTISHSMSRIPWDKLQHEVKVVVHDVRDKIDHRAFDLNHMSRQPCEVARELHSTIIKIV